MNKQVEEDFNVIAQKSNLAEMSPEEFRNIVRRGEFTEVTAVACRSYVQANLAIVPKDYAFEFLLFAHRNPRAFYVIDVTEPGDPHPRLVAPEADLRTDLPRYRVFQDGELIGEPTDIIKYWRDDLVTFLIGCSQSFDWALQAANLHYRLFSDYTINRQLVPAGRFQGPMQSAPRAFKNAQNAVRAIQISSRHLIAHGPPIHIGDPATVGVKDLGKSDSGWIPPVPWPPAPLQPGEILLWWATGANLSKVAMASKIPFMIVHRPGCMFITNRLSEELAIL